MIMECADPEEINSGRFSFTDIYQYLRNGSYPDSFSPMSYVFIVSFIGNYYEMSIIIIQIYRYQVIGTLP